MKWVVLSVGCLFLVWWFFPHKEVTYHSGVLVNSQPVQTSPNNRQTWQVEDYTLIPLAEFSLGARVLSKSRYRLFRESDLSPYDLALGWEKMSNQSVVDSADIKQRNRFFFYRYAAGVTPSEMTSMSSNMHMIPANDGVKAQLDAIRHGDIIHLKGRLVEVKAPDGWSWKSSLSRTDTMGGACELVWVEEIRILTDNYADKIVSIE